MIEIGAKIKSLFVNRPAEGHLFIFVDQLFFFVKLKILFHVSVFFWGSFDYHQKKNFVCLLVNHQPGHPEFSQPFLPTIYWRKLVCFSVFFPVSFDSDSNWKSKTNPTKKTFFGSYLRLMKSRRRRWRRIKLHRNL